MKIKTILTTFMAIALLSQTPIPVLSQTSGFEPNIAAASFSTFSMPQNLGATVNSATDDQQPTLSPNGLSLYFMSTRPGGLGGNDVWVSQRATLTSAWGAPQNLAILNTSGNEAPASISPDGREMFMQSNRPGGVGGVDLYRTTRTDPNDDFGWTAPVNLGAVINSTTEDQNSNYFVDTTTGAGTLYFTSDRNSATAGIKDVYQSTRNADGTFNPPTLVTALNSAADENRVAISRDGLEIFLSSRRLGANFSIFVSTRASLSATWSSPVHISGLSIPGGSSSQPHLSPDNSVLYFVSNSPGGIGGPDLYTAVRVNVNRTSPADFDGDGRSDISVFRPSDGTWYVMQSGSNTFRAQRFGTNGDQIVPGDYDGDGRTDFAVFRPSDRYWYIQRSSDNSLFAFQWGLATDKPVPGDYDGDGKTDIAIYRDGVWYIVQSSNGNFSYQYFGLSSDIPVASAYVQ